MAIFILIWVIFAVLTAIAASARGRDPIIWFLIGAALGVFGLIAVLVMEKVTPDGESPDT